MFLNDFDQIGNEISDQRQVQHHHTLQDINYQSSEESGPEGKPQPSGQMCIRDRGDGDVLRKEDEPLQINRGNHGAPQQPRPYR